MNTQGSDFDRLQSLYVAEDYEKVLESLETVEAARPLEPRELVLRGRAILLADSTTYELRDAESAFKNAIGLDAQYVPALLELGWYYYSVDDDPKAAEGPFRSALRIAQTQFSEAAAGTLRCVAERNSPEEALALMSELQQSALDSQLIDLVVEDYKPENS